MKKGKKCGLCNDVMSRDEEQYQLCMECEAQVLAEYVERNQHGRLAQMIAYFDAAQAAHHATQQEEDAYYVVRKPYNDGIMEVDEDDKASDDDADEVCPFCHNNPCIYIP